MGVDLSALWASEAHRALTIDELIGEVVALIQDEGITCTDDPAAFWPNPIGALVGPPSMIKRGMGTSIVGLAVYVVCTQPLTPDLRNQLWETAVQVADRLGVDEFDLDSWGGGPNDVDVPGYRIEATLHY